MPVVVPIAIIVSVTCLVASGYFLQEAVNRVVGDGGHRRRGANEQERAQDCDELLHAVSPLSDSLVGCEGETVTRDLYSR